MHIITQRQRAVLDYLKLIFETKGYWPSVREIQAQFAFKSTNAVIGHLKALIAKGYITKIVGCARAYQLNDRSESVPQAALEVVTIPVYGSIAAGYPDHVESTSTVDSLQIDVQTAGLARSRSLTFALKVSGDSMIEAGIQEGDVVILEKRPPKDNDIVAALIDYETTLKRFIQKAKSAPYLKAENKNYAALYPVNDLMIQGVAKAIVRTL